MIKIWISHRREYIGDITNEVTVAGGNSSAFNNQGTILKNSKHHVWVDFESFVGEYVWILENTKKLTRTTVVKFTIIVL